MFTFSGNHTAVLESPREKPKKLVTPLMSLCFCMVEKEDLLAEHVRWDQTSVSDRQPEDLPVSAEPVFGPVQIPPAHEGQTEQPRTARPG